MSDEKKFISVEKLNLYNTLLLNYTHLIISDVSEVTSPGILYLIEDVDSGKFLCYIYKDGVKLIGWELSEIEDLVESIVADLAVEKPDNLIDIENKLPVFDADGNILNSEDLLGGRSFLPIGTSYGWIDENSGVISYTRTKPTTASSVEVYSKVECLDSDYFAVWRYIPAKDALLGFTSTSGYYGTFDYYNSKTIPNEASVARSIDAVNIVMQQNVDDINESLALKNDLLVSGTNIKTINGESVLGSGNVEITVPQSVLNLIYAGL